MKPAHNSHHKSKKNSTLRVGDWICQFCNNYNYSFRTICTFPLNKGNRCSAYPQKPSNLQLHSYKRPEPQKKSIHQKDEKLIRSINDEDFPKVVFLMLGDEGGESKEEEVGSRLGRNDQSLSMKWIQKLIED